MTKTPTAAASATADEFSTARSSSSFCPVSPIPRYGRHRKLPPISQFIKSSSRVCNCGTHGRVNHVRRTIGGVAKLTLVRKLRKSFEGFTFLSLQNMTFSVFRGTNTVLTLELDFKVT